LIAVGCARPSQPTQPAGGRTEQTIQLNTEFRLAFGKEAVVDGSTLRIRFDTLLEDSRCPINVQCVWAGNAKIILRLEGDTREGVKHDTLNVLLEPRAAKYGSFVIRFESLDPAPHSEQKPDLHSYVATLSVKPVGS
jgi:hypothetical protein